MAVKEGYRQTEIGVIPEDWDLPTIREVSEMVTVGFVGSMAHLFTQRGVPLLRGQNVLPGRISLTDTKFISSQTHTKWKKSALRAGDIVIVRVGYPGTSVVIPEGFGEANAASLVVVRPRKATVCSDYFCFSLLSDIGKSQIDEALVGGAQQVINIGTAASLRIPLPPTKAEQEAIAEALNDADALIESLEQLISKKRQIKQGAMQGLLTGKKRLPGFSGEWEQRRLGQLLLSPPGYGINAPATHSKGNLPTYIRITDIDDYGNFRKENRVAVNHPAAESYYLNENEIVFARTGASVGKSYLYKLSDGKVVFAGFLIRAKIDTSKLNPIFFFNYTSTAEYWDWVQMMSMRSGQPGINGSEFASLGFLVPPTTEEQSAIAEILNDMDAEIASLETKLAKARQVKQGMMRELLTGNIRLIQPEEAHA